MKETIVELVKQSPFAILGAVLLTLAALGIVPYGDRTPLIEAGWRYFLAVVGLLLVAADVYRLWGTPLALGGRMLSIDPSPILGGHPRPLRFRYDELTTVDDFLDKIWTKLKAQLPPHSYGQEWILQDKSGHFFYEIGTQWAKAHGRDLDKRVLSDVNIMHDSNLSVVRPKTWMAGGKKH